MNKYKILFILVLLLSSYYLIFYRKYDARFNQKYENTVFTGPTSFHAFEVRNGELWGWGNNEFGQLGDGSRINRIRPVKIGISSDWVCASTGSDHSLGLKTDGTIWAWGSLNFSEYGDNATQATPLQIGDEEDWSAISAGRRHNLALKTDGSLWAWGSNENGQLGIGEGDDVEMPTKIGHEKWIKVVAGEDFSLAINSDGTLWTWGVNVFGQLGTGDTLGRKVPTQIGKDKNWQNISISNYTSFGFFGFEGSSYGLKNDGSLWAWGSNDRGQLGVDVRKQKEPVKIECKLSWKMFDGGFGIKSDGSLWTWGPDLHSQDKTHYVPIKIGGDKNWKSISIGYNHYFATKTDGSLWVWGANSEGQLGLGGGLDKEYPTLINRDAEWLHISGYYDHCLGIKSDGSLWAWGLNVSGELGIGNTKSHFSPKKVGAETDWLTISAGAENSLGIKTDGSLWEWGSGRDNTYRVLPFQIGCDKNWLRIESGYNFNIAGRNDGSLWAWGDKQSAGISDNYSTDYKMPSLIFSDKKFGTFAVDEHSWYAIKDDDTFWAFGGGLFSNIDEGSVKMASDVCLSKIAIFGEYNVGLSGTGRLWAWKYDSDAKDTWSLKILGQIGLDSNWIDVSASYSHILGLKSDGTLFTWGTNKFGELGTGDFKDRSAPIQIGSSKDWVEVVACGNYSLAVKIDGTLWSWGKNSVGQLGHGDTLQRVLPTRVTTKT